MSIADVLVPEFDMEMEATRNLLEAILWHGGEAQRARDAFAALSARDRGDLLAFLGSL